MSSIDYSSVQTIDYDPADIPGISYDEYLEAFSLAEVHGLSVSEEHYQTIFTGKFQNIVSFLNFVLPENERCSDESYWEQCQAFARNRTGVTV